MKIPSLPCLTALALTALLPSCTSESAAQPTNAVEQPSQAAATGGAGDAAPESASAGVYALTVESLAGEPVDLSDYAGKVSLVVNVASRCGYTPQYAGLQQLHQELADRGFQVLGFPCNDFGGQEPGTPDEIRAFCSDNYDVTFPLFAKVRIKGKDRSPLYARLVEATGETPGWNFCKYLIGKDGQVLGFWASGTRPDDAELRAAIERAL